MSPFFVCCVGIIYLRTHVKEDEHYLNKTMLLR